jgi:hypothetical protein
MKLDVAIAGSANDHFFSNIAFLKKTLNALGSHYASARVIAALGEWQEPMVPDRWKPYLDEVDFVWVEGDEGLSLPFAGQHFARVRAIRAEADLAIICDADVCFVRKFDARLDKIHKADAIAGVMAHYHFPTAAGRGDPDHDWDRIGLAAIGRKLKRRHRYLFGRAPEDPPADAADSPLAPFYINYGVMIGTPQNLKLLHDREKELIPVVASMVLPYFSAQISAALVCAELRLPTIALPARFNFPNRPEAESRQPGELERVKILHYMYEQNFKRSRLFSNHQIFRRFLESDLEGVDGVFQRFVRRVCNDQYPFPVPG